MWRREPYRVLFPLGGVLAWIGVLPWLFFALRARGIYEPLNSVLAYRSYLHPLAELEGFLGCFAIGLVFTVSAPRVWEFALSVVAPVCAAALAAVGRWPLGQMVWLALLLAVLLRHLRGAAGAWLLSAVAFGAAGAALAAFGKEWWLRELGRDLVMQGMSTALAVGAARILRGDREGKLALHLLGVAVFAAGFWLGARYKPHLGYALRAAVLIAVARPVRPAFEMGPKNLRRGFAHLALWLIALGTAWIALFPEVRRAGLHVLFLGAFAALLCAGFSELRRPGRRLVCVSALFALSMLGRALVELDPRAFHLWMGISAASFLAATALCVSLPGAEKRSAAAGASRPAPRAEAI
jgi:hypothetical protein